MSHDAYDPEVEMNPNNSVDSEDITLGLKTLRLPSRVSSNSSSRNPSIKSPVLPQGILPVAAPTSKNRLEELLSYVGNGDNDWADDMPDFNSSRENSFISLNNGVPEWPIEKPQKEIYHPKLREKKKHSDDHHQHHKDYKNHNKEHHQQQHNSSKNKNNGKRQNGLSSDAMRLMPVDGWKPDPIEFSEEEDDYEKYLDVDKYHHQLETPPSSKGSVIHSKWANPPLPTGPAKKTRKNQETGHQKQKSKEVTEPAKLIISETKQTDKPTEEIKVTRIHYTDDVKKEKHKEVVIKSKWA